MRWFVLVCFWIDIVLSVSVQWTNRLYEPISVESSDFLLFSYGFGHDVWRVPDLTAFEDCSTVGATKLCSNGPCNITDLKSFEGQTLYFICSVQTHCDTNQQKIQVTVLSAYSPSVVAHHSSRSLQVGQTTVVLDSNVTSSQVHFRVTVPISNVWIGFGLASTTTSEVDRMIGGKAVIGLNPTLQDLAGQPSVGWYALKSHSLSGIQLLVTTNTTGSYTITAQTSELEFQVMGDDLSKWGGNGTSTDFILAFGQSPKLDVHAGKLVFSADFSQPSTPVTVLSPVLIAHIVFVFLAFFLFMPLGALVALTRSAKNQTTWFLWHRNVQLFAVLLGFVGCILGFAWSNEYSQTHVSNRHQQVGVSCLVLLLFQLFNGLGRPSHENKGRTRTCWAYCHRITACALFMLALANIIIGPLDFTSLLGSNTLALQLASQIGGSLVVFAVGLASLIRLMNILLPPIPDKPEETEVPNQIPQDAPMEEFPLHVA